MSVVGIVPAGGSGERLGRPAQGVRRLCRPLIEWSLEVLEAVCDRVVVAAPAGWLRPAGSRAASRARPRCATRWRRPPRRARRWCTTPPAAGDARAGRGLRGRADGRGRRDRGRAGHRHGQGGLPRRHRAAHARPLAPVGGPDAPGVPGGALRRALDVDDAALAAATDDASLVEAAGGTVRLVEAPPENFKVTTEADLARAEAALC